VGVTSAGIADIRSVSNLHLSRFELNELPREIAAVLFRCYRTLRLRRLMCGKALPFRELSDLGLCPAGAEPRLFASGWGRPEAFRTSGGGAGMQGEPHQRISVNKFGGWVVVLLPSRSRQHDNAGARLAAPVFSDGFTSHEAVTNGATDQICFVRNAALNHPPACSIAGRAEPISK
jgi:hypothetical protein